MDKKLLIKDLCARVPFKVKGKVTKYYGENIKPYVANVVVLSVFPDDEKLIVKDEKGVSFSVTINEFTLYLKPMYLLSDSEMNYLEQDCRGSWGQDSVDYFNENHYDFRGLIDMGIAKIAPKNIY